MMNAYFASTARGLEELLKNELATLGAEDLSITQGGVHFRAQPRTMYTCLMWSRLASRILLPVSYTHLTLPTNREVVLSVVAVSIKKKKENSMGGVVYRADERPR